MSELTGNRTRTTAGKLGLPHLAETINEFTAGRTRRRGATSTSSTGSSPRNWPSATTAASARACDSRGCRTTRHSMSTTSPSSPTSTHARSKTSPPARSSKLSGCCCSELEECWSNGSHLNSRPDRSSPAIVTSASITSSGSMTARTGWTSRRRGARPHGEARAPTGTTPGVPPPASSQQCAACSPERWEARTSATANRRRL